MRPQNGRAPRSKRSEILAHRPPKAPFAYFLWRCRLWTGTTFATCVMETWEVYIVGMQNRHHGSKFHAAHDPAAAAAT